METPTVYETLEVCIIEPQAKTLRTLELHGRTIDDAIEHALAWGFVETPWWKFWTKKSYISVYGFNTNSPLDSEEWVYYSKDNVKQTF